MKTFHEFINESSKEATFKKVFGGGQQKLDKEFSEWTADVTFKSFVDMETAKTLIRDAGIMEDPSSVNELYAGGDWYVSWSNAKNIKPAQIRKLKDHSFVISARRYKVA